MKLLRILAPPLVLGAAAAQSALPVSVLPESTELNRDSTSLLMSSGSRIQQFYEMSETGAPSSTFSLIILQRISLRHDGPTGGPTAMAHTLANLEVRIGGTAKTVDELDSVFATNLTHPLTTAFSGVNVPFVTDATATANTEAWGGPNGQLHFDFGFPRVVVVPAGGCLVIEFETRGNSNGTTRHEARLDFHEDLSAVALAGTMINEGQGCGINMYGDPATLNSQGQYDPGTAFFHDSRGFTTGGAVVTLITAGVLTNELLIPGTPGCWLYLDPDTGGVLQAVNAGPGGMSGGALPLPKAPQLCGAKIYIQNLGIAPRTPANPAGIIASNYQTIELGCVQPPVARVWHVANDIDPDAPIATRSVAGGLALRIE